MKNFLHSLGFHFWKKTSRTERYCTFCLKKQIYIDHGPISGMADFAYWDDI